MQQQNRDDDMEEEELEDVDGEADPLTSRAAFKKLVIATLEAEDLLTKRAAKMEILDFLTLLNAMNQAGIHFKWVVINSHTNSEIHIWSELIK